MDENNHMVDWLHRRGITDRTIEQFGITFGTHPVIGPCITLPVHNKQGTFLFNKYRRDPLSSHKPKYVYDQGGKVSLYGINQLQSNKSILITEGEMDALVAHSKGINAVTSTGGAMSFQPEWRDEYFSDPCPEITICYDNDEAGAIGMVKTLEILPSAKVCFIPEQTGVKDISDYVERGGDLAELLRTARNFTSVEEVIEDRSQRLSLWLPTRFHDAYIDAHEKKHWRPHTEFKKNDDRTEVENARAYPIPNLIKFVQRKALCIWHEETTPSLSYYPKTNTVYCFGCGKFGDAIDIYRAQKGVTFPVAVQDLNRL